MAKKNEFLTKTFQGKRASQESLKRLGWIDQHNDTHSGYFALPTTKGLWIKSLTPVAQVPYRLAILVLLYLDKNDEVKRVCISIVDLDRSDSGMEYDLPLFQHDLANIALETEQILVDKIDSPKHVIELMKVVSMFGKPLNGPEFVEFCSKYMLKDTYMPPPDYPSNADWSDQTHITDDLYTISMFAQQKVLSGARISNYSYVSLMCDSKPLFSLRRDKLVSLPTLKNKVKSNDLFDGFEKEGYHIVVEYFTDKTTVKSIAVLGRDVYG